MNVAHRVVLVNLLAAAVFVLVLQASASADARQPAMSPEPWTHYFGLQDREAPWAGFRRGIVRNSSGWALVRDTEIGSDLYATRLRELADKVRRASMQADLVLPVGAVLSGRDVEQFKAFVAMIERDNGVTWKALIKDQVEAAAAAGASGRKIYWQIDNEINSRHMAASAAEVFGWPEAGSFDDPRIIPVYAEYILAPIVEAMLEARADNRLSPTQAGIMLGSVANATRASSEQWLDDLLSYRIEGRFAPSLKGYRVADKIEVISVHYVATRDEDIARGPLPRIFSQWVGQGAVNGVWVTEELGKARAQRNLGSLVAIRLVAGYMRWIIDASASSEQIRASFWGATAGDPESTAVAGLNKLYDFLGDQPWIDVGSAVDAEDATENARIYAYRTQDATKEMILVAAVTRDRRNAVKSIAIGEIDDVNAVEVYKVSAEGLSPLDHRFSNGTVGFDRRVKIGPGTAILVLVDRGRGDRQEG